MSLFFSLLFINCCEKPTSFNSINDTDKIILETTLGDWDENIRENGNVIKVGNRLIQVYSGYNGDYRGNNVYIGLTYSDDNGITWRKINNNGNIIPSTSLEDPYIIFNEANQIYFLYAEYKEEVPFRAIRVFSSLDLITWNDEGYALEPVSDGWEKQDVSSPVIVVKDNKCYLIYEGRGKVDGVSQDGAIGIAVSTDFTRFKRISEDPIFTGTNLRSDADWCSVLVPDDITFFNNKYYLTYHGYDDYFDYFASGMLKINDLKDSWIDLGKIVVLSNIDKRGQDVMFYPSNEEILFITSREDKRYIAKPTFEIR